MIKAAVKDARTNEPVTSENNNVSFDVLEHRKKNLRTSPAICYTHKLQFNNRRDFRLHLNYEHRTEQI